MKNLLEGIGRGLIGIGASVMLVVGGWYLIEGLPIMGGIAVATGIINMIISVRWNKLGWVV